MLVGGVIYHQIHDQPHVPPVHFVQQPFKVLHSAELLHDGIIIPDVITVVVVGRVIDRGQPQCVYPQLFQVVQLSRDARQVSDPVPVAVTEAARINLIEYCLLPPLWHDFTCGSIKLIPFTVYKMQQRIIKVCPKPFPC